MSMGHLSVAGGKGAGGKGGGGGSGSGWGDRSSNMDQGDSLI